MVDFSWSDDRSAGIFLHISSLHGEFGIGSLGKPADEFIDFLKAAGMTYWQMCPLGPTGYGDSPYQSFSAFAGNTYFIDFDELAGAGLVASAELDPLRRLPADRCDYGAIYAAVPDIVRIAAARFKRSEGVAFGTRAEFEFFCKQNADWLDSYALFCAFKKSFGGAPWYEWPPEFRDFSKARKQPLCESCGDEIYSVKFGQWAFFRQYAAFKNRANARGVKLFGDIPIFLSRDSADVWTSPELFELDSDLNPTSVAGVGPDYFSEKGQLWGNPLYNWKGAKAEVYQFWRRRIAAVLELCDVVRFDHFRGFADYWSIPADAADAREGKMMKGPGEDFFKFLRREFPEQKFVAEDLGLLSEAAISLRDSIKIPAMAVLQFAFGDTPKNPYLPHNVRPDRVYYTGTHDNNTAVGWYASASEKTKDEFRRYFRVSGNSANWDMIHAVMMSVARTAVFPMQDILGLPESCRTNTPGKPDGNWTWRMTRAQLDRAFAEAAPYLKSLSELSDRLGVSEKIVLKNSPFGKA